MDNPFLVIGIILFFISLLLLSLDAIFTIIIGPNLEKSNSVSLRVIAMCLMAIAIILAGILAK